jgi:hypothetical protein
VKITHGRLLSMVWLASGVRPASAAPSRPAPRGSRTRRQLTLPWRWAPRTSHSHNPRHPNDPAPGRPLPDHVFQSGSALTPGNSPSKPNSYATQIPGQPALNSPRFNPTGLDKDIEPPAAPNTISRKRGVFHATLNCAVELGLLPANRIHNIQWRAPTTAAAIHAATVASPRTSVHPRLLRRLAPVTAIVRKCQHTCRSSRPASEPGTGSTFASHGHRQAVG